MPLVRCGNKIVDSGETCDGSIKGQSCTGLGYNGGDLSCGSDCQFNVDKCIKDREVKDVNGNWRE